MRLVVCFFWVLVHVLTSKITMCLTDTQIYFCFLIKRNFMRLNKLQSYQGINLILWLFILLNIENFISYLNWFSSNLKNRTALLNKISLF